MTNDRLHKLFLSRSHFCPVAVATGDGENGSRIGGCPPSHIAGELVCPRCGGGVTYYLTLDLTLALALPAQLSIFYCRQFSCLLASGASIAPPELSSIVVAVHSPSPRSSGATPYDSTLEPRALRIGEHTPEPCQGGVEQSKLGGSPVLVQNEGIDRELQKSGPNFFFQWNELDLPRNMHIGTYPFAAGVLYLFCPFTPAGQPDLNAMQAFWQRS
jgi:hypothetical protein